MINEIWEGLKQAIIRPVMAAVTLIHPGKETNMGDLEKIEDEHTRLVSEGRFEEATKILNDLDDNILKNMQKELEMLNAESEEVPDQKEEEDSAAPEAVPETFTREEVVRMLQEMQQEALDVIKVLLLVMYRNTGLSRSLLAKRYFPWAVRKLNTK